jgi:L-rhamnose-H+ transport protein
MVITGIVLVLLSGICNGLFTVPLKLETRWRWENVWFIFIVTSCVALPWIVLQLTTPAYRNILLSAPPESVTSACVFGFIWGFGAICFGRSVHLLGVSLANSLVLGISSGLGSLVPLFVMHRSISASGLALLFTGVAVFLIGVWLCGRAGRLRDGSSTTGDMLPLTGYIFATIAGVMSAIFNIGYALALPIADTGVRFGYARMSSINCIWLLMLGAGAIPNLVYCMSLMMRNRTAYLLLGTGKSWLRSMGMGLLWGGSIFLYGAATPKLGNLGPSVGWPLSLATGLLVANLMGLLLGEWRDTLQLARRRMYQGIGSLLAAIALCAAASKAT